MIDYSRRYLGQEIQVDSIYRFLDKLSDSLNGKVQEIAFRHIRRVMINKIGTVFYNMTTLHFETDDEDDLRKTGFSKVGKHQNSQIYLGLLLSAQGQAIGYEIFEGNIFEGHTLREHKIKTQII